VRRRVITWPVLYSVPITLLATRQNMCRCPSFELLSSPKIFVFFSYLGTPIFEIPLSVDLIMMGISLKSKIPSPSRFALTARKLSQDNDNHPTQPIPNPQHRICPCSFSSLVELRYTEVWTRDHLEWFNVDFDPSRFHTIPMAFTSSAPVNSQGF